MSEFVPTPHPVLKLPTQAQALALGPERLSAVLKQREELILLEKDDPYHHGFELSSWKRADAELARPGINELLILGGNRASKSQYAGKKMVKILVDKPGARVWCFHSKDETSKAMQQPIIWNYLPREWKALKKGQVTNISYTQKNGFSEGTFVCPNGSQCWFKNYEQDALSHEGDELDGAWPDELFSIILIETLRYRLVTRGGILIGTFTPIDGYTPTVKSYLQGAKTVEDAAADLLPGERVPLIQQPVRQSARIIYFHTRDNPYNPYENLKKTLAGAPRIEILCRAYGVPTKAIQNRFPKFNDRIHVIRADLVPKEGTRYQIVDPCGGRNWFGLWLLIDPRQWHFVYREWPSPGIYIPGVGDPGWWAEPDGKKHDGKPGDAQKPFGFGLNRYKEEFERIEEGEQIYERFMDSRYGNAQTVAAEKPTTLIEECEEIGLFFTPTPGDNIDEGIDLINDALDYDVAQPVSATNSPKLYISEVCRNLLFSLREWTGADGRKGACKDPIDNLRYGVLSRLEYIGKKTLEIKRGGSY